MTVRRWVPIVVGRSWPRCSTVAAHAQASPDGVDCGLPESNAEALDILSNFYPGYWWDHTDLTVAVQAHPKRRPWPAGGHPRGDPRPGTRCCWTLSSTA